MATTTTDATAILDLNSDCILEVFKYLDLLDLCAVADTCSRFRQNAKLYFKYSKKTNFSLMKDIKVEDSSVDQVVLKTSKILRNFGTFFTIFREDQMCRKQNHWDDESQAICRRKIFELVIQYCSGTLTELFFHGIDVEDEMIDTIRLLLEHLQKLSLFLVGIGDTFLNTLPLWSSELRELKLTLRANRKGILHGQLLRFDGLHKPFKKLVSIVLDHTEDLTNNDVEEMLKHNPQLKEIGLLRCRNLDHQVIRFIVNHTPDVEKLQLNTILLKRRAIKCFAQLTKLKLLVFYYGEIPFPNLKYIGSAIQQINAANIPLKRLSVCTINGNSHAFRFFDEITKLEKLELLALEMVKGLTRSHIQKICECTKLRKLILHTSCMLTVYGISVVIEQMDTLEYLSILSSIRSTKITSINIDNYKQWTEFVERRLNKKSLEIRLTDLLYTTNMSPGSDRKGPLSLFIGCIRY